MVTRPQVPRSRLRLERSSKTAITCDLSHWWARRDLPIVCEYANCFMSLVPTPGHGCRERGPHGVGSTGGPFLYRIRTLQTRSVQVESALTIADALAWWVCQPDNRPKMGTSANRNHSESSATSPTSGASSGESAGNSKGEAGQSSSGSGGDSSGDNK